MHHLYRITLNTTSVLLLISTAVSIHLPPEPGVTSEPAFVSPFNQPQTLQYPFLFQNGSYVTSPDSYCSPIEHAILANASGREPLWDRSKREERLARFIRWRPQSDRHTVALMRLYWNQDFPFYPKTILTRELSGSQWVRRFATSRSTSSLDSPFRESAEKFISAMRKAGAYVKINATYRPPERAYLMHCAYRIAREDLDPRDVPYMVGVDICWVHPDEYGNYDPAASKRAAEQMVYAYRIAYPAALFSPHIEKRAVDMTISWNGNLNIKDSSGRLVRITTGPRNGDNPILHKVGRSYGVIKFVPDPPHWQDRPVR